MSSSDALQIGNIKRVGGIHMEMVNFNRTSAPVCWLAAELGVPLSRSIKIHGASNWSSECQQMDEGGK